MLFGKPPNRSNTFRLAGQASESIKYILLFGGSFVCFDLLIFRVVGQAFESIKYIILFCGSFVCFVLFIFRVVRQAPDSIKYILFTAIDCCGDLRELPYFLIVKPVADLIKSGAVVHFAWPRALETIL